MIVKRLRHMSTRRLHDHPRCRSPTVYGAGVPRIELVTEVPADRDHAFAASLDVGLHTSSMRRNHERAVAGVTSGRLGPGDRVTWRARHLGVWWQMSVRITEYDPPSRFVDEQVSGPFAHWRHVHLFQPHDTEPGATVMSDVVDFSVPAGIAGRIVGVTILQPYLRRLIATRNALLAEALQT
jgi:ligand-binding SRPBCC domain-containing protein